MFWIIHRSTLIFLYVCICLTSTAFAANAQPLETYTDPTTGMQFVYIPGGTFIMGDPSGKDPFAVPAHEVTVKPFYLGKYEVTFAEYDKFARETKRDLPDDMGWGRGIRPVINVTWHDAVAFTKWLSKKTGKTFRLPSEAEWELAGRGGTTTYYYWGDNLGRSNANCDGCGSPWDDKQTAAVGSFRANPYGLYDMTGNVYEWCLDSRHRSYEGAPKDGSAWLKKGQKDSRGREFRINRGGSWFQPAREMTIYRRCWDAAEDKRAELGFRVLLEP
ncbi:MAG: formylglycine-generating enzyme family protein [Desulfuromonadaceae bacterium]|nr:formylglycine-generating enzyme family protein [Desulfuromonadaceae bacterium]